MRWPLSLLFRGDRDTAPAADGGAPGAAGEPDAVSGTGPGAGAPVRPAAWSGLAPIQRTVGEAPLTAPTAAFGRDLAGRRSPDPILRPLGHDVAADGPAGLVSGIATPLVAASAPISAMAGPAALPPLPASSAPRGVQRRARTVSTAGTVPGAGSSFEPSPALEPVGDGSGEGAVPPAAADAAPVHPPRVLPVVAPSAVAPALAATRVASASAPEPVLVLAPPAGRGASAAHPTSSDIGGSVEPSAPVSTPPPLVSSASGAPGEAATRGIVSVSAGTDTGAVPASAHHSLGASRRLGLGAPLAGRPAVQRSAAGPDLHLARARHASAPPAPAPALASPVQRAVAAPATLPVLRAVAERGSPPVPAGTGDTPPGGRESDAPAVPSFDSADADRAQAAAMPLADRSRGRALVGDPGRWSTSLLPGDVDAAVGGGPVEPTVRTPGAPPLPEGTLPPSTASSGAPPPAHAAPSSASIAPAARAPSSRSAAPPAPVAAPSSATSAVRSAPLVVARSLRGAEPLRSGAGAAVAPAGAAARIVGTPAPAVHGATTTGPASHGTSGSPVAAGRVSRMPVARATAFAGLPGHAVGVAEEPVPVSRLADTGGSAAPPPGVLGWTAAGGFAELPVDASALVQRAVAIDEMATEATTGAGAAPEPAAGGAGGAGAAGQDYEEIADHVYDRIRSRFATELLLDRERMGLLIDG